MLSWMVVRNFLAFYVLADRIPTGQENAKCGYFQAILAQGGLWHLEKSRARAENGKKHNFPALGLPKSKEKVTTLSGMVVHNFLTFYLWPDGTPVRGKSQNTGILGHFGLGQPLALREIPGLARKWKNAISQC